MEPARIHYQFKSYFVPAAAAESASNLDGRTAQKALEALNKGKRAGEAIPSQNKSKELRLCGNENQSDEERANRVLYNYKKLADRFSQAEIQSLISLFAILGDPNKSKEVKNQAALAIVNWSANHMDEAQEVLKSLIRLSDQWNLTIEVEDIALAFMEAIPIGTDISKIIAGLADWEEVAFEYFSAIEYTERKAYHLAGFLNHFKELGNDLAKEELELEHIPCSCIQKQWLAFSIDWLP